MDLFASLIRNLMRLVDGLFVYLVGAIIVWNSPLRQRLGDKVAGTVVVPARVAAFQLPVPSAPLPPPPTPSPPA